MTKKKRPHSVFHNSEKIISVNECLKKKVKKMSASQRGEKSFIQVKENISDQH